MRFCPKAVIIATVVYSSTVVYAQAKFVDSPVDKIYAPDGYDDNDQVEVLLTGKFPNECYKPSSVSVVFDGVTRVIELGAQAEVEEGACAEVLVPFVQVASLGRLAAGGYILKLKSSEREVSTTLTVVPRRTESPEETLYAPVENAAIKSDEYSGRQYLELGGTFPYFFNGCMDLREIQVERDPRENLLVVRPYTEVFSDQICKEKGIRQNYLVKVPLNEPLRGEGLLHVRLLNGTSLNRVVSGMP